MMRKQCGWILGLWAGLSAVALADTVLVTGVSGAVTLESVGNTKMALEPFVRLKEGDRLNLPAAASLSLVYVGKARQESWQGAGSLLIGEAESKAVAGQPQLKARPLPPEVARQMNRTPVASADGKVGMLRTRSVPPVDAVTRLEREYQEMRSQTTAADILPEVYLLAGLYDLRQYERVEAELKRIVAAYPNDPGVPALRQLYTKALNDAREGK